MKFLNSFDEFNKGMNLSSMKDSFNDGSFEGKEKIVAYLQKGDKTIAACSYDRDVFTGERIPGKKCLMTDGEYSWSSCLYYYVDRYNLRLLPEFEEKILKIGL